MTTTTAVALRPDDGDERQLALSTADPRKLIEIASKQATALKEIIDNKKLYTDIKGRKHVSVEGWQTLGALNMLQAFTERVTVEKFEDGEIRATAMVSARRVQDGVAVAQAEGFCSSKETNWKGRDEFAIRSMAQTRATSKVFRQCLAWVMTLAGYEVTPLAEKSDEGLDRETRELLDGLRKNGKKEQLDAVAAWMKDHKFKTWADFYSRATNDEATAIAKMLGWTDTGFDHSA
jgi:hypothetical protein